MFTLYLCLNSGSLDFVLCTYGTQAVLILGGIKVFSCYQENVCSLSLLSRECLLPIFVIKRMFAPYLCREIQCFSHRSSGGKWRRKLQSSPSKVFSSYTFHFYLHHTHFILSSSYTFILIFLQGFLIFYFLFSVQGCS